MQPCESRLRHTHFTVVLEIPSDTLFTQVHPSKLSCHNGVHRSHDTERLSLSAFEGLNLTGQRVKLPTKGNAPEKALNSSSQATTGVTFFPRVKKINTESPLSGEGHASPQLTNPSLQTLHTADQAASRHCYLSFPQRSSENCQPLLSTNSNFATTLWLPNGKGVLCQTHEMQAL